MPSKTLLNVWEDCGLRSSPYFQDLLQGSSGSQSLKLFVAREKEQQQLLATIGSKRNSRQAVAGFPGVGKTTLVEYIKMKAREAGYCVANEFISITPQHDADTLLGQLIAGIYDAICAFRSSLRNNHEMKMACRFVNVIRQQNVTLAASAGIRVLTGELTVSSEVHDPSIGGLTLPARNVIKKLLKLALSQSKGIILHLNNLENLSESDTARAADLLRSVRDTGLIIDGLHIIVVGPTSAVQEVIGRHSQIEGVFTPIRFLEKLTLSDVYQLLENRYKALQIDRNKPYCNIIEDSIVNELYTIFNGDLRGILRILDYGIENLLLNNKGNSSFLPFTLDEFRPTITELSEQESEKLENFDNLNWKRIVKWADADLDSPQTQDSLSDIWEESLSNVSINVRKMVTAGFVEILPIKCERKTQYSLTGKARLATYY